jgi:chromosome segregation protein
MRISKIKLAGFKSFVDPSTLHLTGNLSGVVGPNGCGKSNIIDAILWVMGESSAKHLRGDSMADVIFNGSNTRKPVGQAVVEIIFDNKDGRLGGQYASYAEVSIKRQMQRDGASAYYLNGSRCRRRDITDLFLGTGLGSRSYAVIEQGMISRVIEAKPEELRVFIEEAAGISKYKERRRETENRLAATKENLNRLNDIRIELHRQLEKLQQQAKDAEEFQILKQHERRLQAEILALASRDLVQRHEDESRLLSEHEADAETSRGQLTDTERAIERLRENQTKQMEVFNEAQARYYQVGAEISRLEQGIQHGNERRRTLENSREQTASDLAKANQEVIHADLQLTQVMADLGIIEPELEAAAREEQGTYQAMIQTEQIMQGWQAEWDEFNRETSTLLQEEKSVLTRIEHLQRIIEVTYNKINLLRAEHDELAERVSTEGISLLEAKLESQDTQHQELKDARSLIQERIQRIRSVLEELRQETDRNQTELQTVAGRISSLHALQQSALGKEEHNAVNEQLKTHGLTAQPRLAELISVEEGWETAAETVLGPFLEAVCVEDADFSTLAQALSSLRAGVLSLVNQTNVPGPQDLSRDTKLAASTLASKVASQLGIQSVVAGVYLSDTLEQALALRGQLLPHESIISREGCWLGANWVKIVRYTDARAGLLKREKEIKALEEHQQVLEALVEDYSGRLEQAQEDLRRLEWEDQQLLTQFVESQEQLGKLRMEHSAKQTQLTHDQIRKARLETELMELQTQHAQAAVDVKNLTETLTALESEKHTRARKDAELTESRDAMRESLQRARDAWRTTREKGHALGLKREGLHSRRVGMEQLFSHTQQRIEQLTAREQELANALAEASTGVAPMEQQLTVALQRKTIAEQDLSAARADLQALDRDLREQERQRAQLEQQAQAQREKLELSRMEKQSLRVKLEGYQEQLAAHGLSLEPLLEELPAEASREAWEKKLEKTQKKITRLGAINLAAIEEFAMSSERKTYLDQQHGDLSAALATLEDAIRRIDRETRGRFKETFDKVNERVQAIFPRLFGGGHAHLELTGEDLLDTGITVMARPPGKRNSTIHLLSGGEKALTAVSLVFAIFELNPAPFCLLDEVDAPLDDANAGRLCEMLKSMSKTVQFLFISHNKITMEIADRLIGVTMQEAGVSRLVDVDMDTAVAMAAVG